ncbi:hypothetical protein EGH21_23990 [Halomicroarcula sp. F13]|uniref:Uncharacterized protein n=1 Tax=Haloarcula rubra TaxID=2487747 RepID=A0AAW4PYF9_9EURY|nr:hypothetical protein [Halomicroarcula rubra]MBX0326073.1 hypothetical protein [Halomicroarcula rubra]
MTTNSNSDRPVVSDETILQFVRTHDDPCVTAGEVAEEFNITNEAANYRLMKLCDREEIAEKRVGSSAKVWYIIE